MTFVEFFDKTASENISACLTCVPERVIFIGDNSKKMKKHIANYSRIFLNRGYDIEFLFKSVSKSNLDHAVSVLQEIVDTYNDCVFDITGGEDIIALALGIVYERNCNKNIQIHKFNLRNNTVYDCDKDGITIHKGTPVLSVEENIILYGGNISYGGISDGKTYLWDMSDDFSRDIECIWNICKVNVRLWNVQIGVLEAVDAVGCVDVDNLTTTAEISDVDRYLRKYRASYKISKGIIRRLLETGVLTAFEEDEKTVTVSYKNMQVKKCLTKAGQALEMKIFMTAKKLVGDDGNPVYDDAINGVVIDWDGRFHEETSERIYDTENEIDIMLMHGIVPVFISCKNGIVTADELYKLNTVAERFGSRYSKKVLVSTAISTLGTAGEYLKQRAYDMNINLIDNVQNLDDAQLSRILKNLWCN